MFRYTMNGPRHEMKPKRSLFVAVCSILPLLFSIVSPISALESEKGDRGQMSPLAPPAILSPAEMSEFRGIFKVSFSWSEVPKAVGYHFVLSRDRRFRNIVYEKANVTGSSCAVENLGYGTYFYKISSVGSDGSEGLPSDVRTFVIAPPPPVKPH